jgi:hypothetical protein
MFLSYQRLPSIHVVRHTGIILNCFKDFFSKMFDVFLSILRICVPPVVHRRQASSFHTAEKKDKERGKV